MSLVSKWGKRSDKLNDLKWRMITANDLGTRYYGALNRKYAPQRALCSPETPQAKL